MPYRRWHRIRSVLALLVPLALSEFCWAAPAIEARPDREAMIKAAILFKLTRYVVWEDETSSSGVKPIRFCVEGDDRLLDALSSVEGRQVRGRVITIRKLVGDGYRKNCDVLYLERRLASRWSAAAGGRLLLTVSEVDNFAERGGVIELVRRDRRFGFRINVATARRSGLQISSALLDLAEVIEDEASP